MDRQTRPHTSARKELEAARYDAFVDGVCHAIDELRAIAEAERLAGRLGGAFDLAADRLERTLFAPAETKATPP